MRPNNAITPEIAVSLKCPNLPETMAINTANHIISEGIQNGNIETILITKVKRGFKPFGFEKGVYHEGKAY